MNVGDTVPQVTFKTRVRDESIGGSNPYDWKDVQSTDLFAGRRVVVFSLPGAFTPTCSTFQLPDFETLYEDFAAEGINDIFCMSVNDAFVMNAWAKTQQISKVRVIPDGSGLFTTAMDMMVAKDNLGFGQRSWRYAMVVNDGVIEKMFVEPGKEDNAFGDPYGETSPQNILTYLVGSKV
ncbi:peroxiredoxin [Vibrio sp.]|uniref:peroxiredoxin n=1 Tax=Vibrio sp. TaxID=678 RepID=UPI00311E5F40